MSYSHEYNAIESLIGCAYHEAALKMHLADSELCILYTLHTHGPGCLQSTLYKETGLTKTTVNSALKKLEKGGTLYLTPGPGRVKQDCPVAGPCGGCGLRHISYAAER